MEHFHYTGFAKVAGLEEFSAINDITKKCKTRTITDYSHGYPSKITIKVADLRLSRKNFWKVGSYCQMGQSYDLHCYACDTSSSTDYGCKCDKRGFTVQEYHVMQDIARRNYLKAIVNNINTDKFKALPDTLTDEQIYKLLYWTVNGCHCVLELPSWSQVETGLPKLIAKLENFVLTNNINL